MYNVQCHKLQTNVQCVIIMCKSKNQVTQPLIASAAYL